MKIKKTFLTIAIGIFMVFSLSLVTPQSFAYWASSVVSDNHTTNGNTVTTGTWDQIFPWDANETYVIGDIVSNNGANYQAKKDNPTKEPGVDKGWASQWTVV